MRGYCNIKALLKLIAILLFGLFFLYCGGGENSDARTLSCGKGNLCPEDEFCLNSYCAPKSNYPDIRVGDRAPCETASHCPQAYECVGGFCKKPCKFADDCRPTGGVCTGGYCSPNSGDDDGKNVGSKLSCESAFDCNLDNASTACIEGKCAVTGCREGYLDRDKFAYNGCEYYCGDSKEPPCGDGDENPSDGGECNNECPAEGYSECMDDKSFRLCALDEDGCLRWSRVEECEEGLACRYGGCLDFGSDECGEENQKKCVSDTEFALCIIEDEYLKWSVPQSCARFCSGGECVDCLADEDCGKDEKCSEGHICEPADGCKPVCENKACGSDGCGGNCGDCGANSWCDKGVCRCLYDNGNMCDGICCSSGKTCKEGLCCPDKFHDGCDYEGQRECESTALSVRYRTCELVNGCPIWKDYTTCPDGKICRGEGICGSESCARGTKKCNGNEALECKDEDNDGFVEWVVTQTCKYTCELGVCKGCSDNSECASPTPVCDVSSKTCVGCLSDADCSSSSPLCDSQKKTCVECFADADCASGKKCNGYNKCECAYASCNGQCCQAGQVCFNNSCYTSQCGSKECGSDVNGYVCGTCPIDSECTPQGLCKCNYEKCGDVCCPDAAQVCHNSACYIPQCSGKQCGADPYGYNCGTCPSGYSCINYTCQCNSTVCNGICCSAGQLCHNIYKTCCNKYCPPATGGIPCGDDGCGFNCGDCPTNYYCDTRTKYCVCPKPCYGDCCSSSQYCSDISKGCKKQW
ncbi:MAG: hypothetical protein Kow0090_04110 [Myxococcota bacterium]